MVKKLVLSFVLFIVIPFQISAQWFWQNPLPQGNVINDIEFIDNYFGLAVGGTGTILKTTDMGITWIPKISTTSQVIYKVDVANNSTAYALGNYFILKTTDGGESWFNLNFPTASYMRDIFFLNESMGFIVGSGGNIFYTGDGGITWNQRNGNTSDIFNVITFYNDTIGVAMGHAINTDIVVLKTTNGGNTWNRSSFPNATAYVINDVEFISESKLIAVAYENIFYSTNGGQDWVSSALSSTIYSTSIDFIDSLNGVISGYSGVTSSARIFRTQNAGQTWQEIVFNLGGTAWLNSVSFPTNNFIYAAGGNGRSVRSTTGGSNWEEISSGPSNTLSDVSFYDEYNGVAVGSGILTTTNGGRTWIITSSTSSLNRCISPLQNTYFAVGGYNLLKSTNGGFTWNRHSISEYYYFMTISFADSLNGVASTLSGSEPKIFRTFDGGDLWQQVSTIQGNSVFDICFVDSLTIYASAGNAIVYKSLDGGYNWIMQHTGGDNTILYGIDFVNSLVGYTVGYSGKVFKTINGGMNWQVLNLNLGNGLAFKQVDFIDENNGIVGGGIVASTSDGGQTWNGYSLFTNSIYSATMANDSVWYAVGAEGAILKRNQNVYTPVEFYVFNYSLSDDDITLKWTTATETNNQGFQIERKKTSEEKSDGWKNIGFVNSSGTTTEPKSYSFFDKNVTCGKYQYRLKQLDLDGTYEYSKVVDVEISVPDKFSLSQNIPNPFNPGTRIQYSLSSRQFVTIKVYDVLGKEIATLIDEYKLAGRYEVEFNASNLSSGIYFYRIQANNFVDTKKMLLIK